jgi:hypothetical protein
MNWKKSVLSLVMLSVFIISLSFVSAIDGCVDVKSPNYLIYQEDREVNGCSSTDQKIVYPTDLEVSGDRTVTLTCKQGSEKADNEDYHLSNFKGDPKKGVGKPSVVPTEVKTQGQVPRIFDNHVQDQISRYYDGESDLDGYFFEDELNKLTDNRRKSRATVSRFVTKLYERDFTKALAVYDTVRSSTDDVQITQDIMDFGNTARFVSLGENQDLTTIDGHDLTRGMYLIEKARQYDGYGSEESAAFKNAYEEITEKNFEFGKKFYFDSDATMCDDNEHCLKGECIPEDTTCYVDNEGYCYAIASLEGFQFQVAGMEVPSNSKFEVLETFRPRCILNEEAIELYSCEDKGSIDYCKLSTPSCDVDQICTDPSGAPPYCKNKEGSESGAYGSGSSSGKFSALKKLFSFIGSAVLDVF